jgi:hypothetical protein
VLSVIPSGYREPRRKFRRALCSSKTLKIVSLSVPSTASDDDYNFLNDVARIPSLTGLQVHSKTKYDERRDSDEHRDFILDNEKAIPQLRSLIRLVGSR